jgi:hypothetical protein
MASTGLLFQLNQVTSIIGPYSLDVLKLNNKLIWLFGDVHIPNNPECNIEGSMFLHDYLDLIFQKSPVCSDFFIETGAFTFTPLFDQLTEGESNISYYKSSPKDELAFIILKYWDCLGPLKSECKYGNVRLHNIDIRINPYEKYTINQNIIAKHLQPLSFDQLYNFWEKKFLWVDILRAMMDGDLKTVSILFQELYIDLPELRAAYEYSNLVKYSNFDRISKQFKNIPRADDLKSYLLKSATEYISTAHIRENEYILYSIENNLSHIASWFMDAYTLARMIKTIYLFPDSGLLFTYVGYYHTRVLLNALITVYSAQLITSSIAPNSEKTCIDLDHSSINRELELMFTKPSICTIKSSRSVTPYIPSYSLRIIGPSSMHVLSIHNKLIFLFEKSRRKIIRANSLSITLNDFLDGFFRQNLSSDLFLGKIKDVVSSYPNVRFHNSTILPYFNKPEINIRNRYFRNLPWTKTFWNYNIEIHTNIISALLDGDLRTLSENFQQFYADIKELRSSFNYDRISAYYGPMSSQLKTLSIEIKNIILEHFIDNFKMKSLDRTPLSIVMFTLRYLRKTLETIYNIIDIIITINGESQLLFIYDQDIALYLKILDLYSHKIIVNIPRNEFFPHVDLTSADQEKIHLELSLLKSPNYPQQNQPIL